MSNTKRNDKLAKELRDFLAKSNLTTDTRVYFNNKAYEYDDKLAGFKVIQDINPKDYFEYANPDTVSMSFEGSLYDVLNHHTFPKLNTEFRKIFEDNNCYFEFGHSWNLTVVYN